MKASFVKGLYVAFYLVLLYSIYLMINLSLPYTALKSGIDFLISKQKAYRIPYWRLAFYLHVFFSIIPLVGGLTQFNKKILVQYPKTHRVIGLLYWLIVLLVSAPTGLIMGFHANGGLPAKASFIMLSLLWFLFTILSIIQVKKADYTGHAEWMLRSYALTLSAITLRFYALLFDVFNIHAKPLEVYVTIAWLSWVPNLLIAECLIKNGFITRLLNNSK